MIEPWHECYLKLVCEKKWDELTMTNDPSVRHCSGCQRTVHLVETAQAFDLARAQHQCVALGCRLDHARLLHRTEGVPGNVQERSPDDDLFVGIPIPF